MSKSRRKNENELSRLVGILFLELIGAIVLLNLFQFAQQQRTQAEPETRSTPVFEYDFAAEKTLPKMAVQRYNARW